MLDFNFHDSRFYPISFFYYDGRIVADIDICKSDFKGGNFFKVWPAKIVFSDYKNIQINLVSDDGFFMIYDFVCSARMDGYFDFSLIMDESGASRIDVISKNASLIRIGGGVRQLGVQYINEDKRREYFLRNKGITNEYNLLKCDK